MSHPWQNVAVYVEKTVELLAFSGILLGILAEAASMMAILGLLLASVLLMSQAQADRPTTGEVADGQGKPVADSQVVFYAPPVVYGKGDPVEVRTKTDTTEDVSMTLILATVALGSLLPAVDGDPQPSSTGQSAWRYVLPAPGDPFEHAPFRALVLSRDKPAELVEKVTYRGDPARRRYAQVRFGSPSSTRVTIVVDTVATGEVDLYADADRNLKIDDRDRVPLSPSPAGPRRERIWRLPLEVAIVEQDSVRTIPRAVVFRLGASGQTLGYAAAGYLEGKVTLGASDKDNKPARSLAARRVDGDGNGLLADAQDRIWIDFNGDGNFDASSEQFLYTSVLNLEGSRYVVLSDELGTRLAFEPLLGTGTLRLGFKGKGPSSDAKAVEMHATAISRDGSVFAVTGSEPAIVPAGEYRLGSLTIALDDPKSGQRWSFVFSDGMARGQPRWYKVEKDNAVTIDPIGTPSFEIVLRDQVSAAKPGEDVGFRPALYTGDGLLIIVAYCGNPISPATQETLGARIALMTADGKTLATAHSGFS